MPYIPQIAPKSTAWEVLLTASEELKRANAEDLRLLKYENKWARNLATVGEVEAACLKELKEKYLPDLRQDAESEGEVVAFALTRVGIHQVLASEAVL